MANEENNYPEQSSPEASPDSNIPEKENLAEAVKAQNGEDQEQEFPPPGNEDKKEKELNVTTIFSIGLIALIVVIILILFLSTFTRKKKVKEENLKTVNNKTALVLPSGVVTELDGDNTEGLNNGESSPVDNKNEIPSGFDIGEDDKSDNNQNKAPAEIASVGSSGSSSKSDRPDTRNSKSTRSINGLVPKNSYNSSSSSSDSTYYNSNNMQSSNQRINPYTEEYKQSELARIQSGYSNYGTANTGTVSNSDYMNKQNFYNNNLGNGGSGQFLTEYSLWDGTIITAALQTAINTDNPGVVIARVTENVYSSYDASYLLIPEGSLLYATYNSSVSYGQDRIQVAWNLLIRPDGYRVELGNMNGVDEYGASGYEAKVSNHPFETLKALGLVALYSVIQTEITNDVRNLENEYIKNSITDVYAQASQIGNKMVDKALDIKPRLTIASGKEIKIITNIPLSLPPVQINQPTQKYIRH